MAKTEGRVVSLPWFHRAVRVGMCLCLLASQATAVLAQEPVPAPGDLGATIEQSRELIKSGDYDRAIELLRGTIAQTHPNPTVLREAYLLLVKTLVYLGNDLRRRPQGRVASELNYEEARRQITEMLSIPALRHTRVEPETEYPEEMLRMFAEVRGQIFGSFRVLSVQPADAAVILDTDTLSASPGDSTLGEVDIPVGAHLVVVRHERFNPVTDRITISPGATLERSYRLTRKRDLRWYAPRVGGGLALLGGVIAAIVSSRRGTTGDQPLPGPPSPPSSTSPP